MIMLFQCLFSFLLGTISGSAMTCFGERTASGKSWAKGRSECDSCHHVLHAGDLIPVVSWLIHHGRCRYCGAEISLRYLWTELICGIVFVWFVLLEKRIDVFVIIRWMICSILLALSVTDLDSYQIPDVFVLMLLLLWFLYAGIEMMQNRFNWYDLADSLAGAVFPSAGIWILSWILACFLKKETMGGGDIKLLSVMGFYNGLWLNLMTLVIACIFGLFSVLLIKKEKIPFGPSLSLGMLVVMLFKNTLSLFWMFL